MPARQERKDLDMGAISSDPARTAALEGIMTASLASRDIMIAGIEAACVALGKAEVPAVRYFQRRPGGETAKLTALEGIAASCFQVFSK